MGSQEVRLYRIFSGPKEKDSYKSLRKSIYSKVGGLNKINKNMKKKTQLICISSLTISLGVINSLVAQTQSCKDYAQDQPTNRPEDCGSAACGSCTYFTYGPGGCKRCKSKKTDTGNRLVLSYIAGIPQYVNTGKCEDALLGCDDCTYHATTTVDGDGEFCQVCLFTTEGCSPVP